MDTRALLISAIFTLSACGGGGNEGTQSSSSAPATVRPAAGRYDMELLSGNTVIDVGNLIVTKSGFSYYDSYNKIGSGSWEIVGNHRSMDMILLTRNGVSSAGVIKSPGTISASIYSAKLDDSPRTATLDGTRYQSVSLPDLPSLSWLWVFDDIIPFCMTGGACNEHYQASLMLATDGTINGSDSNGCQFSGTMQAAEDGAYPLTIQASNCTNTDKYIANQTYHGFVIYDPAQDSQPMWLTFSGVTADGTVGMSLRLHPN